MRTAALLCVAILAGCAMPNERWAQRIAQDCVGYGFTPGTPEYSNCLMVSDQSQKAALLSTYRPPAKATQTLCRDVPGVGVSCRTQ